jgi:NitT/TauT family transport system permease protein
MTNSIRSNKNNIFLTRVGPIILLLAVWQFTAWKVNKTYIVPSPYETVKELYAILTSVRSLTDIAYTLGRMVISFLISFAAGVLLAVSSYRMKASESFISPFMTVIKSVPTMGVILLSLIWFGSEGTVLFVCSLIVTPVIYTNVLIGLRSVDRKLLEMGSVFRFSAGKNIRYIYWPSLKPFINAAITSGISLNIKVLIAAEVLGQPDRAIGTDLFNTKAVLNTPGIFAWSVIVIILSYSIEKFIMHLRNRKSSRSSTGYTQDKPSEPSGISSEKL